MREDMTGKAHRRTGAWRAYAYFEGRDEAVDLGIHPSFELANLAAGTWLKSMARGERVELFPVYKEVEGE